MARPRKPTELLQLSGAFDKNPQRARPVGPKSRRPVGEPPEHLSSAEAACWREFIAQAPAGILTSGDRWILESLCRLMAKYRADWLTGPEFSAFKQCLVELGATPSARSRLMAPPDDTPTDSPWDQLAAAAAAARAGVATN